MARFGPAPSVLAPVGASILLVRDLTATVRGLTIHAVERDQEVNAAGNKVNYCIIITVTSSSSPLDTQGRPPPRLLLRRESLVWWCGGRWWLAPLHERRVLRRCTLLPSSPCEQVARLRCEVSNLGTANTYHASETACVPGRPGWWGAWMRQLACS